MALLAIWVDSEHAKLFHFSSKELTHKNYTSSAAMHQKQGEDKSNHLKKEHHFFKEFMPDLTDAEKILILGPGMAKQHLEKFLKDHHSELAKKIVGCESVDHPSEPQIIAIARKFFSIEHLV